MIQCDGDKNQQLCVAFACFIVNTCYSSSGPTCSRYPCRDTCSQMPETWGHCRHSCSKLSATNQLKPSRLLLSSNPLAGFQTYLQTCYCMCWESHADTVELHISARRGQHCCVSLLRGFHVFWLWHVLQSWPLPCVRLLILLLCRNHTETWLWSMCARERGGGLPVEVIVITLHIYHHVNWIQMLLWSPSVFLFELIINSVSVCGSFLQCQSNSAETFWILTCDFQL